MSSGRIIARQYPVRARRRRHHRRWAPGATAPESFLIPIARDVAPGAVITCLLGWCRSDAPISPASGLAFALWRWDRC